MESFEAWQLLGALCADFQAVLGEKLTGFYVHGSLAMGCFSPASSDADCLAVARAPLTRAEKLALLERVYDRSRVSPSGGIEMSVVLESVCRETDWPAPYELHYSPAWKERYEKDPLALCSGDEKRDPDLAAHFAMTRARGRALFGPEPADLFAPVPPGVFSDSLAADTVDAETAVFEQPVYVILNLCRALAFKKEALFLSKREGGEWALTRLDRAFHPLVRRALAAYASGEAFLPEPDEDAPAFVRHMRAALAE